MLLYNCNKFIFTTFSESLNKIDCFILTTLLNLAVYNDFAWEKFTIYFKLICLLNFVTTSIH